MTQVCFRDDKGHAIHSHMLCTGETIEQAMKFVQGRVRFARPVSRVELMTYNPNLKGKFDHEDRPDLLATVKGW